MTTQTTGQRPAAPRRFDGRTFALMFGALLLGVAWAVYNYDSAVALRGDAQTRPLVWAIFAAPLALFLGWWIARRRELARAAFTCFCLYFFTPFVAARIESLFFTADQAQANGHNLYFTTVIILHAVVGLGLVLWRAFGAAPPVPQANVPRPADMQ